MREDLAIGGHILGSGHLCFIIGEAGVNHNGDVGLAHKLIDVAADAGVDAVKFQTFDPDKLAAPEALKAEYQIENTGGSGNQLEMLRGLVLPRLAYPQLMAHAVDRRVVFLSTPFDEDSADFLEELGLAAFKISSGDLTNHPFLSHLARKKRPLLLSTGMATLGEVELSVEAVEASGGPPVALLHCVTNYPADPTDCNLNAMVTLRSRFHLATGWSDHTNGFEITLAAVALGANLVEKHFTLDSSMPGPDHRASLEPHELRAMIEAVRRVENALGDGTKRPRPSELALAAVARKSLFWKQDIEKESVVEFRNFIALRPGTGISPQHLGLYVGRKLGRAVREGKMVIEQDFARIG